VLTITVTAPDGTKHPFKTQEQAIAYIREQDPDGTQGKWILVVSGAPTGTVRALADGAIGFLSVDEGYGYVEDPAWRKLDANVTRVVSEERP
jgi:hypothetical protein